LHIPKLKYATHYHFLRQTPAIYQFLTQTRYSLLGMSNKIKVISYLGFSLIELSIVMLIVGVLIYATLTAGAQQLDIARIIQTKAKLEKIETALALHLKLFGYLPCPAYGTDATASPNFGKQSKAATPANSGSDGIVNSANCIANLEDFIPVVYVGVVPVETLGLNSESMFDGWGNRITYIVSKNCVDPDNWVSTNKYKCTDGVSGNGASITLKGKNNQAWPTPNLAVYISISHGRSGNGAWSRDGVRQKINIASTANSELANGNLETNGNSVLANNASIEYFDHPLNDGDKESNYFDNLTKWATAPQLNYTANH
jgi:prepilin-type N-terminal cleavage/methylation domain-containing protein